MSFDSIDNILAFAIDKENEAVDFYMDLSTKETFKSIKETFVNFANEEKKHANLLKGIAENNDRIDEYELKDIPDLKISDYMVETEYQEGMFMQDILRLAMKREENAVKLYQDLGTQVGNAKFQKVFQMLAQEEQKHKLALESMYDDFLADNEN